jgi:hypothetical protein
MFKKMSRKFNKKQKFLCKKLQTKMIVTLVKKCKFFLLKHCDILPWSLYKSS